MAKGGGKQKIRKSIGELDVTSFLTSLGKDKDDDVEDDEEFHDAATHFGDSSFQTAFEDEADMNAAAALAKKPKKTVDTKGVTGVLSATSTKNQAKKTPLVKFEDKQQQEEKVSMKKKAKLAKDIEEQKPSSSSSKPANKVVGGKKSNEQESNKNKKAKVETKSNEQDASKKKKAKLTASVQDDDDEEEEEAIHRRELESLSRTDPEFYKHLQSEASELLEFGDDDDEEDVVDDEEEEEQEDVEDEEETLTEQQEDLTLPALKKLESRALRGDAASVRKLIRAFRNAVKPSASSLRKKKTRQQLEEDGEDDQHQNEEDEAMLEMTFSVQPEVYERVITVSLNRIAAGLDLVLGPKKQQSPHFPAHSAKIRQLLVSLTRAVGSRDTSPNVVRHLLLSLRLFVPYCAGGDGRKLMQVLVSLWGRQETEGPSRLAAFFRIRQLCDVSPATFRELALKDMYVMFARGATSAKNAETRERIAVQARCVVDLYGMDYTLSYRVGFQHLRQLALHVRSAMASKTQETLQSICSWQFVHCLRLWGFVLATHFEKLQELRFPLIQVALGVLSLVGTSRYDPLRLHCVEVINRVCEQDGTYAPVSVHLLHMLGDLDKKKLVASTEAPPELSALLRFKQDQLRKAGTRLVLVPRVCELLRMHLKTHRHTVAFPELFQPIKQALNKTGLNRADSNRGGGEAWRLAASKAIRDLLQECEEWSKTIKEAREGRVAGIKRPGGPSDLDGCDKFAVAMRAQLLKDDESKMTKKDKKKQPTKASVAEELFPTEVEIVDNILSEAALMSSHADDTREDQEGVRKLNPKDFIM